jgi:protein-S-isoprenylcysteine O-methyltransferase Ste14
MAALTALTAGWDRLPFPAEHAVGMVAGLLLQRRTPLRRLPAPTAPAGWPLVAAGLCLNVWAVAARGGEAIEHPARLVTGGPQAWTRNPMYVGWTLLHLGVGVLARSPWVLVAWPVSFALIHRSVLHEERRLAQRFGHEFTEYRAQVPRYVRLPGRGT